MGCNGSKTAGSAAGEQNNAPKDSPKSEQSTAEPTTPKKEAQQKGNYICILYYIFFVKKFSIFFYREFTLCNVRYFKKNDHS